MKKLLLGAITTLAFLFGFASCSGNLMDLKTEKLYLAGDMNSYTAEGVEVPKPEDKDRPRNAFITYKDNEKKQTYKFIYNNNMTNWGNGNGKLAFKVCYDVSSWNLDWGAKKGDTLSLVVNDTEWLELEHRDSANTDPGNIIVEDLLDGEEYTIEVDYDAPATSVKIKIYGNKPDFPSLRFVVVDKDGNTVKEIPLTRDGVSYSGEFASDAAGEYSGYLTNGYLYWGGNGSFNTNKDKIDTIDFEVKNDEAGNVKMCYINIEVDPANLSSIKTIEFSDLIDTSILGVADIVGGFNGWQGSKFTRVNDTTYTFDFTNAATTVEFDIREKAGSWNVGRWFKGIPADTADRKKTDICDDIIAAKKGATPVAVTPIYYKGDSGEDGQNLKITGLPYETGYKFRITATIVDADKKAISLTVQALDDIPESAFEPPKYAKVYVAGSAPLTWGLGGKDAITVNIVAEKEECKKYYYTFTAASTTLEFKVALDNGWEAAYSNNETEDGKIKTNLDAAPVEFGYANKKNAKIEGLTTGEKYTMVIDTSSGKPMVSIVSGADVLFAIGNDDFGNWSWDTPVMMTPVAKGEWKYEFTATKPGAEFKFQTTCGGWHDNDTWNAKKEIPVGADYTVMENGAGGDNMTATLTVGTKYVLSVKSIDGKYNVKIDTVK